MDAIKTMSEEKLKYLFQKNAAGLATPEEKEELRLLLADEGNEVLANTLMEHAWHNFEPVADTFTDQESARIFSDIQNSLKEPVVADTPKIGWMKYAVAASVLIALSFGMYFLTRQVQPAESFASLKPLPGKNKAVLTLSNGKRIDLDGAHSGTLGQEAGIKVYKDADGRVTYQVQRVAANASDRTIKYNSTATPRGGEWHLILADGTDVWLNAASSLRYPVQFNGDNRTVELTGEAYFEVAKDVHKPFIVHTERGNIKVLGTHFNVNAYSEESMNTTLLEGSVELSKAGAVVRLQPGEQGTIPNASANIRVSQVNTADAVAWKNGYFTFKHKPITEIMKELSRWYDIEIIYQGDLKDRAFDGMYSKSKPLPELLAALQLTGTIHFKMEERRVIVMP